jgi:Icc-related predicted phosphoesterase
MSSNGRIKERGLHSTQIIQEEMKIALFSDVHGRLRVILHLIRNWQMAHREYLDGALIAGDLGCFPDLTKVDKATQRWLKNDPEEAGFSLFFSHPHSLVERLFQPEYGEFSDVRCCIFFVAGNHEDCAFLNARQQAVGKTNTFTVDCYQRIHCISDGTIANVHGKDGKKLRVAGLWGIENTSQQAPYKIKTASIQQLESQRQTGFDLLLTHDAPSGTYPMGGSLLIAKVIKACQPSVHLFGHVHQINSQHEFRTPNCRTRSFIFKDIAFGKKMNENLSGAMAILDWDGEDAHTSLVTDCWLKQMFYTTWEKILPDSSPVFP